MNKLIFSIAAMVTAHISHAITIPFNNLNIDIADGDGAGVFSSQTINPSINSIADVNVTLNLSGEYAGDLYIQLEHAGIKAVLLNRIGRTSTDEFGYTGGALNIKLDDQAAIDIHDTSASGWSSLATLQPDAREIDPGATLLTDSRTAFLSAFNGVNPDGDWTLFVADVSSGGTSKLLSWGLELTPAASTSVPDQISFSGIVTLFSLCIFHFARSRKNNC